MRTVVTTFCFLTLLLLDTNSVCAGKYKYTDDILIEKYDRQWTELRQKIGEVYEINPSESRIKIRFYEKQNISSSEFIVTQREKFVVTDVYVSDYLEGYWVSLSDKRPSKVTYFFNVTLEVKFESGKIAYVPDRNISERIYFNYHGVNFIEKLPNEEVENIINKSRNKRQVEIEARAKDNVKRKAKKKKQNKEDSKIERSTETRLELNE